MKLGLIKAAKLVTIRGAIEISGSMSTYNMSMIMDKLAQIINEQKSSYGFSHSYNISFLTFKFGVNGSGSLIFLGNADKIKFRI